jgi:hypothetical protein
LLDPCKHHQAEASEAEAVLGMDVKCEDGEPTKEEATHDSIDSASNRVND